MRAAFRLREAIWAACPEKSPLPAFGAIAVRPRAHCVEALNRAGRVWLCASQPAEVACPVVCDQQELGHKARTSGALHRYAYKVARNDSPRIPSPIDELFVFELVQAESSSDASRHLSSFAIGLRKKESCASPHLASRVHRTLDVCRCAQCDA